MKELNHLSDIYKNYDTFILDLWGVVHNGVMLNQKAIEVIEKLTINLKKVIFLSNAPRPSSEVAKFLLKMKMDKKFLSSIMTSGEAAMHEINKNKFGKTFFHLGPIRDSSIFEKVKENKTDLKNCDFILCTGLFDERARNLECYRGLLKKYISKKFVCTNPDLTVHRGNVEEFCAGSIAKIFEEIGGEVSYFGKPYKEIYNLCFKPGEKVLAIGDNLRTDIKGANRIGVDCIFITDGVHRDEFKNTSELDDLLKKYKVKANYFQKSLKW